MKKYNFENEKLFWYLIDLDKEMKEKNPKEKNNFLFLKSLNKEQVEQLQNEYFYIEEAIYTVLKKHPEYITSDDDHFEIPDSLTSKGIEATNKFCNEEMTLIELENIKKEQYLHPLKSMTPEDKEEQTRYNINNLQEQTLSPIKEKIKKLKEADVFSENVIDYIESLKISVENAIFENKPLLVHNDLLKNKLISASLRETGFSNDDEIITHETQFLIERINKIKKYENKEIDFKNFNENYIKNYTPSPINNVTKLKSKR